MKVDSAFQIGKTHDICQDFALANSVDEDMPFVIVSDGCSSSPNTDIGSRILSLTSTHQLERIVKETGKLYTFSPEVSIVQSQHVCDALNISPRAVDATLLMATFTGGKTQIKVLGDGVVAIGTESGEIITINFDYVSGYPFYMSYLPEYSKDFINWEKKYSECEITVSILNDDGIEEYSIFDGKESLFCASTSRPEINILGETWNKKININDHFNKMKWVTLMSDGVHTFYEAQNTDTSIVNMDIGYREVIKEALNFKNFNGKFMQRRLNRFLKLCQKNNWHHADDISFGTIYFGS